MQTIKLLFLLSSIYLSNQQDDICQLYVDNIQCQEAQNCKDLGFFCRSSGDEDEITMPCSGIKLNLFNDEEDYCGWCSSKCVKLLEEGQECTQKFIGGNVNTMCGAGLTCVKSLGEAVATCIPMQTHCIQARDKYDQALESGHLGLDMNRPVCDQEGKWSPVQCSGSGVCRCVSPTNGAPIFGIETNLTEIEKMTCDCARDSYMLKEMGCNMKVKFDGDVSELSKQRFTKAYEECMNSEDEEYFTGGHLRCSSNGNYDEAQCIQQTYDNSYHPSYDQDMCFCYQTGDKLPGNFSMEPISTAHITLGCDMEPGYYRTCQNKHINHKKMVAKHKYYGETYISTEKLERCGLDGHYDKVQKNFEDETLGYCSDKHDLVLGDGKYKGIYAEMDCECAMVESMMSGWGQKPNCVSDGSYNNKQCNSGKCYCVDSFGRQCCKEVNAEETLICPRDETSQIPDKAPKFCPDQELDFCRKQ